MKAVGIASYWGKMQVSERVVLASADLLRKKVSLKRRRSGTLPLLFSQKGALVKASTPAACQTAYGLGY